MADETNGNGFSQIEKRAELMGRIAAQINHIEETQKEHSVKIDAMNTLILSCATKAQLEDKTDKIYGEITGIRGSIGDLREFRAEVNGKASQNSVVWGYVISGIAVLVAFFALIIKSGKI